MYRNDDKCDVKYGSYNVIVNVKKYSKGLGVDAKFRFHVVHD